MYLQARLDMLRAEKSALADAAQRGLVGEEVQHALARQLNDQVAALELIQANRGLGDEKE